MIINILDSFLPKQINRILAKGVRDQIIQNRADDRRKDLEQKKLLEEHKRILNPLLPSISEKHLYGNTSGGLAIKRSDTMSSASTQILTIPMVMQNRDSRSTPPRSSNAETNRQSSARQLVPIGQPSKSRESSNQSVEPDDAAKLLPKLYVPVSSSPRSQDGRISRSSPLSEVDKSQVNNKKRKKRRKKKRQ